MADNGVIGGILRDSGIFLWGVTEFEALKPYLINCSAKKRLPEGSASIIVALFPYYSGEHGGANLSKYAMPGDYHIIVGEKLGNASQALKRACPTHEFATFCDASPLPEVEAARLAGLGTVGRNGLLISPEYGSYVFIGEIVTDMMLEPSSDPGSGCIGCGICTKSCPSGALCGGRIEKERCLSFITQKKGRLTQEEESLIRRTGCIWGCDICQNVCPMNRGAKQTCIESFLTGLKTKLERDEIFSDGFALMNSDRAYMWRGETVLKRNICIIESAPEDNIDKSLKE